MKNETTKSLITLGALGIIGYLIYNYLQGTGTSSGSGGSAISPVQNIPMGGGTTQISGTTLSTASFGNLAQHDQLKGGAVVLPIQAVATIPAGAVRSGGGNAGLLIKGTTKALFISPGAAQTAGFINKYGVIQNGKRVY
jgi:hypothetical protein